jgi:[ribosomal protein S5]-alanine N-acetyltransferase
MNADELYLKTKRLELTILSARDLDYIWPSVSNPTISEHMSWNAHQTKSETLAFLERTESEFQAGRSMHWGIRLGKGFCGIFSLINIVRLHRALRYDRAELAYWCAVEFQNQGIMIEAGLSVIGLAFEKLKLNRLVVGHHLENERSQKLIKRLHFKEIGIEREAFAKSDRWIDIKTYELLRKDYTEEEFCRPWKGT